MECSNELVWNRERSDAWTEFAPFYFRLDLYTRNSKHSKAACVTDEHTNKSNLPDDEVSFCRGFALRRLTAISSSESDESFSLDPEQVDCNVSFHSEDSSIEIEVI